MREAIIRNARLSAGRGVALLAALFALGAAGCTDAGRCELGTPGCVAGGGGQLCSNSCAYASDGECDDSGPDSVTDLCPFGSDCQDCGARPVAECPEPSFPVFCPQSSDCWSEGVDCWSIRVCDDGYSGCIEGYQVDCSLPANARCVAPTVCSDSCPTANDGTCNDGSDSNTPATCALGTDCTDCEPQPDPCADQGRYSTFCPATPNAPSDCWSWRIDCDTVQSCEGEFYGCAEGERLDCGSLSCVASTCTDPALPVDCATGTCFPVDTDYATVTTCPGGGTETACPFGFVVDCAVPATPTCAPEP